MKTRALAAAMLALVACIKPPDIVMVDRGTALEQQASGSFEEVERRLDRAAVEPAPASLTPEQLDALGMRSAAPVDGAGATEADRLDLLLVQHCVGEGADGLLVQTPDECRGFADAEETPRAVERVNAARHQLWRWMQAQRPDASSDSLRRAWRSLHVSGVVCGALVQGDDGQWRAKAC